LFNRGHWCPYCVAQLKSFQGGLGQLAAEGIGVIAASADDIDHARETKARTGATFPIGSGLPVIETADAIERARGSPASLRRFRARWWAAASDRRRAPTT
jgi:peroxiredoxin